MQSLLANLKIEVNSKLYHKDPESSELGKKIVENSILLIHELGFDEFTFKKLGEKIGSNESSIYRYFENKHKLLLYLATWFWSWQEYRLVFGTSNINDNWKKLEIAIQVLTENITDDEASKHINEAKLYDIIVEDFLKNIQTKQVDSENKEGFFLIYKRVIYRLIEIIEDVDPNYQFSKTLASSIIEGALHQHFLKKHLKTITNCNEEISPSTFYIDLIHKILLRK